SQLRRLPGGERTLIGFEPVQPVRGAGERPDPRQNYAGPPERGA
ncbi:unnamed protein product, partial [marine sediment metagenome]